MRRENRLRKGAEFDTVYSEGTVVSGPLVVLRYVANECGHPRWGFAVGKRLAKQAVVRNRTKRRLRELARILEGMGAFDIILTARAGALDASDTDLRLALQRAVRKAGIGGPMR